MSKVKTSLTADIYFENAGLFSGKLGMRIFSEALNIVDSNINPNLCRFAPFDGEGFVRETPRLPLIESGVLRNVVADQRLAHKYKISPTGNGMRDYKSAPKVGYNSVEIMPGTETTERLLKRLPQCVVVMYSGGGEFNDLGDFSQPVEFSYLLEYGEVVGRLPALTLTSSV